MLNDNMAAKMASDVSYLVYYYIYSEFKQIMTKLHGSITDNNNKLQSSFIDLYLVFPRNFRIVFLTHTNTVILLEPYCGTITEPGLPVILYPHKNTRMKGLDLKEIVVSLCQIHKKIKH